MSTDKLGKAFPLLSTQTKENRTSRWSLILVQHRFEATAGQLAQGPRGDGVRCGPGDGGIMAGWITADADRLCRNHDSQLSRTLSATHVSDTSFAAQT